MRKFEIQTLSERNYNRLGFDPIVLITGGYALAQSLFPNLFGNNRKLITDSDWSQLFPGNGYWTVLLKKYCAERIKYDVDMRYLYPFEKFRGAIADFVVKNSTQICPDHTPSVRYGGTGTDPGCWSDGVNELVCQPCMSDFQKLLAAEQRGGGDTFPPGQSFNLQTLLLIGGGVLIIAAIAKKKRSTKK
jgi:hypothetical protein